MKQAAVMPIIGISPRNSYFNESRIKAILSGVRAMHPQVVVMIPDVPAIHTYKALGYNENQARKKAVQKGGHLLRNRVVRSVKALGLTGVNILNWENDVENNPHYQENLENIRQLYEACRRFREKAKIVVTSVLQKGDNDHLEVQQVQEGACYILKELAYLDAAAQIHDVRKAIFHYHRPFSILEEYISGAFDQRKKDHMGFKLI